MQRLTLKPSVLVAASLTRTGGVSYAREVLNESQDDDHEIREWKTTRDVPKLSQLKKAEAVASQCRRLLGEVCYRTSFGLVCAKEREPQLLDAAKQIRQLVEQANLELNGIRLHVSLIRGEIVSDDQAAAEAILQDLAGFFTTLQGAVEGCDVKQIRQTLATMRGVEQLLEPAQSETLQAAVRAAKHAAGQIAKEVEKKGREISEVVQELDLSAIDVARTMFLEFEPAPPVTVGPPPAEVVETAEVA